MLLLLALLTLGSVSGRSAAASHEPSAPAFAAEVGAVPAVADRPAPWSLLLRAPLPEHAPGKATPPLPGMEGGGFSPSAGAVALAAARPAPDGSRYLRLRCLRL